MRVMAASGGVGVLDTNFGNSEMDIRHTIAALGASGRDVYLKQYYAADFCYSISYALFYSQLFRFFASQLSDQTVGKTAIGKLWLLPWGAMVFDWLENLSIGMLLAKYPVGLGIWYVLANVGTVTKSAFIYTATALLVLLVVVVLAQRWRSRA